MISAYLITTEALICDDVLSQNRSWFKPLDTWSEIENSRLNSSIDLIWQVTKL